MHLKDKLTVTGGSRGIGKRNLFKICFAGSKFSD